MKKAADEQPAPHLAAQPAPERHDVEILATLADLETLSASLAARRAELRITSRPTYVEAVALAKEIKGCIKEISERCDPFCDLYRGRLDRARAWKNAHVEPLIELERGIKSDLTRWQDEQDRLAEDVRRREQAKRDEEARRQREKLEGDLRAETEKRLTAERQAAEERARTERAEAARRKAEADAVAAQAHSKADKEKAERMQREAALARERADAERKAELARIEERRITDAAAARRQAEESIVAPVVATVERVPTLEGASRREAWSAQMTDRVKFVRWLATQPDDMVGQLTTEKVVAAYLVPLSQLARSLRRAMHVDGVEAKCETIQSLTRTRTNSPAGDDRQKGGA